ncbi:MAG: hypothetical protein ACREIV_01300 [Planctomycetaceae bacterium]
MQFRQHASRQQPHARPVAETARDIIDATEDLFVRDGCAVGIGLGPVENVVQDLLWRRHQSNSMTVCA